MTVASQIVLNAFLAACPPEKRELLLHFLPQKDKEVLEHLSPSFQDLSLGIAKADTVLQMIHFSWIEPILRSLASSDMALFLAAMPKDLRKQLAEALGFSQKLSKTTNYASDFITTLTLHEIKKDFPSLLPFECIPKSPFTPLLFFSYAQLLKMIDLLSMHDLAIEFKTIIEKDKIKHINKILSKEEQKYLKSLLTREEPLAFKSMNLQKWDGSVQTFRSLLRQRGLNRFSKVLFGCDPSFLWYVKHTLDVPSATLFQKLHTSLDNVRAQECLQEQFLTLQEAFIPQLSKEGKQL